MAKYDIANFDYESMVDQISGITGSRKKPNFLKRYAPQIIETLVGVTDNYKTYQLRNKMDDANFENTLEVAKLKAEAAKQLKRHKDTKPQYDKLINANYDFSADKQGDNFSEGNLAAARKVFGDQAWQAISQKFSHSLPKATLNSYDDYIQQKANFGVAKKDSEAIENYYNSFVKERARYVYSGQSYDFDKFTANLKTLEEMKIDYDVDNAGLLSKIGGSLKRRINARDEEIDMFRNRYLTKPAAEMAEASEVWKNSESPEQYSAAIKNVNLGFWSALTESQITDAISMDIDSKEKLNQTFQKLHHDKQDVSVQDFRRTFNVFTYGSVLPTQTQTHIYKLKANDISAIRNDNSLTDEEKNEKISTRKEMYSNLEEDYSIRSQPIEIANRMILINKNQERLEQEIKALKVKEDDGTLKPLEREDLKQKELSYKLNSISMESMGTQPAAMTTHLINEVIREAERDEINNLVSSTVAEFSGNVLNSNPATASVPFDSNAVKSIMAEGNLNQDALAQLATRAPEAVNELTKTDAQANQITNDFTSNAKRLLIQAKDNRDLQDRLFGKPVSEDEIDKYITAFGFNFVTDSNKQGLAEMQVPIVDFQNRVNEIYRVSTESHAFGLPGFFHGESSPNKEIKTEAALSTFIREYVIPSASEDRYTTRSVNTSKLATHLYNYRRTYYPNSSDAGILSVNTSKKQGEELIVEAEAEGKTDSVISLREAVNNKYPSFDSPRYANLSEKSLTSLKENRREQQESTVEQINSALARIRRLKKIPTSKNIAFINSNKKLIERLVPGYDFSALLNEQ